VSEEAGGWRFLNEGTQNFEVFSNVQDQKFKNKKTISVGFLSRHIQWHHSHADISWLDSTFHSSTLNQSKL
jgi:hypothetical protein